MRAAGGALVSRAPLTVAGYYRHVRSLGDFRAIDAIRAAREAVRLDEVNRLRGTVPYVTVDTEVWPDGTRSRRLGGGIRVF